MTFEQLKDVERAGIKLSTESELDQNYQEITILIIKDSLHMAYQSILKKDLQYQPFPGLFPAHCF